MELDISFHLVEPPGPGGKPYFVLIAVWPLCFKLSLSLSLSVMSCIETVKLQMVMGMEPKSTCQDTIDHPTGGDRTAIH